MLTYDRTKIERARLAQGMTVAGLARKANLSVKVVHGMLGNGALYPPSVALLAKALDVELATWVADQREVMKR